MFRHTLTTLTLIALTIPTLAGAQTFNPNYSTNSGTGSSFQGLSFSGVGSAVLNCTNIGSTISGAARDLFKSSDVGNIANMAAFSVTGIDSTVAVRDDAVKKQAEKQAKKENCLDGIAYSMAKNVLHQVSNKTLNWVNTGFDGNPLYVRDIDSYLRSIRDQKLQSFLKQVPGDNPIFGNAIRSAITQQVTGYTDGRINRAMNTPEARAYQSFQQDFTQGGWNALLNPQNNPLSAYFSAVQQVSRDIDNAQQNVQNELVQGDGFLSMKKCVEWSNASANSTSTDDGVALHDQPVSSSNTNAASRTCARYETVTPGSIIAQQTAYITNSAVRQLEQADKINEVLGSFFDQLLNRLFANGLGSLSRGRGAGVSSGLGSNVVIGTNGLPLDSFADTNAALGSQMITVGGFNGELDISRPQQLRAIIKTQLDYINRAKDAQVAMGRIVPTLGALDYCLPGPNPTWQSGLSDNFQILIDSIQPTGGRAILYDKVTDTQRSIRIGAAGLGASTLRTNLENSFTPLMEDYTRAQFDIDSITDAYEALEPTPFAQADVRAFVRSAYREAERLVSYNRNIAEYTRSYNQTIRDTEDAVEELQDIYDEVQTIVTRAKNRYIAAQAAAGTPVDTACINQAYVLNNTPIVPIARVESDAPDPFVEQSIISSDYFYNNL